MGWEKLGWDGKLGWEGGLEWDGGLGWDRRLGDGRLGNWRLETGRKTGDCLSHCKNHEAA